MYIIFASRGTMEAQSREEAPGKTAGNRMKRVRSLAFAGVPYGYSK